jgi:hypothetical protein
MLQGFVREKYLLRGLGKHFFDLKNWPRAGKGFTMLPNYLLCCNTVAKLLHGCKEEIP